MERSQYNECYTLPDPCDSESRSTRYRAKKRAREQQTIAHHNVTGISAGLAEDSDTVEPQNQVWDPPAVTPEPSARVWRESISSEGLDISCDQPQFLEVEAFGGSQHVSDDSEDEQLEVSANVLPLCVGDPPLYDGAPITLSSSNLLIMQYKMRHKLTDEGLADLLQLLKLHCPSPNHCLPSIYYFKKHFRDLDCPIQFHYFCSSCYQAVSEPQASRCPNPLCHSDITQPGARSSFIEIPISPQLQTLFQRECIIYYTLLYTSWYIKTSTCDYSFTR